jgi:hypothetical protein
VGSTLTNQATVSRNETDTNSTNNTAQAQTTVQPRPTTLVYSGDSSGTFSDSTNFKATLTDNGGGTLQGSAIGGKTVSFKLGTQAAVTGTTASGTGIATSSTTITLPAGSASVASNFAGDALYVSSSDSDSYTVNRESATITYTGDTLKSTGSTSSSSTTTLSLSAAVAEQADGSLGNKLDQQKLTFTLYSSNDTTMSSPKFTCTVTITATTAGNGTAGCTTGQLPADNYIVKILMSDKTSGIGYYTAPCITAATTITIAGTGFTTGGGWLNDASTGDRSNFGFTVKYLKNANIQGNSLYIYRRSNVNLAAEYPSMNLSPAPLPSDSYNWIIKSNAMVGLTQSCGTTTPIVCTAQFTGKSTITAVSRTTGVAYSLGGNNQFQVDVTDNGEPGSSPGAGPDKYAIRVWNSAGTYYQLGSPATQQAIDGGNIQVRP